MTDAILSDMLGQTLARDAEGEPERALPQLEEQDASLNMSDVSGELLHTGS